MKIFAGISTAARRAFSLIEIMVVVALLSVIVLGLMMMFGQTQRAFTTSMTQVDVLQGGRAATELMTRDLSQMVPAGGRAYNYYTQIAFRDDGSTSLPGVGQTLPGSAAVSTAMRTNFFEVLFFMTKENQKWIGIGYCVGAPDANGVMGKPLGGSGTLYRFVRESNIAQDPLDAYKIFWDYYRTNNFSQMGRVMDGVVHFKARAFDPNGYWINQDWLSNRAAKGNNVQGFLAYLDSLKLGESSPVYLFSNAVPASVEFELGVLEDNALRRASSISDPTARSNYLKNQASRVHIFRQRVTVRNVDPIAYQ